MNELITVDNKYSTHLSFLLTCIHICSILDLRKISYNNRLNAVEGSRRQEEGGAAAVDGNSKNMEDPEKGVQEKKEQKQGKAATNKRKDRVLLVGDSLVRHVGRNLEQQCVGLKTVCKPGGRIEQMVLEVEKRGDKEEAVIVHVGTNNLRMETEEIMKKYEEMIQRRKE